MLAEAFKNVPIYLLGHSEGSVIAPQVAAHLAEQDDAADRIHIAGLLLLCPFSRPMREVLLQQAENRTVELNAMTGFGGALSKAFVKVRGGGGKDLQCNPDDTRVLAQHITQADVTVHLEENMTHILRSHDGVPAIGRYPELIKEPIDSIVGERCVQWLDERFKD